jgi:DNA primase
MANKTVDSFLPNEGFMARIADEVIERIKSDVSLVRLAESQGYVLVKQGKDFALCCPFHSDKTPSCVITPKSNLFNCFGCGAGGSVIDWVMKTQGVSFRHAAELLKNDVAAVTSSSVANAEPVKKTTVPKLAAPVSADADDQELLREVVNYYHRTLLQSPEVLDYLQLRGLDDAPLINHFKLGYANRTLGLRLPQKNRKAGSELREKLQRIGIYRESGHEHLNGSVVVPLLDEAGEVVQLYGRKIRDDLRDGTAYHLYLPQPHAGVFNLAGLAGEEIILCEALLDALTFWRWGFKNVTSSYGVNGFTDEILQALINLKVKRVLIAYDRDDAGNNAALEVAKKLNQHGIDAFRVLFPKGMDANQFACQMQPPQKSLALVIRKAEWLGNGVAPQITTEPIALPLAADVADIIEAEKIVAIQTVVETAAPALVEIIQNNPLDVLATPASPLPASTALLETREDGLFLILGERTYRVRGLDKNASTDQLKVQLMVQRGEAFFIDKLDLYASKQRQIFINQSCVELGVSDEIIKKDLGKLLLALEQEQLKKNDSDIVPAVQSLTSAEREAALALLCDKNLPERILADFTIAGVVGEETNKLVGYLAGVSRKLNRPLAVVIQSSSAAGKSSLMDAVLAFMPEDERVQYSAMTGQSLFYMGETRLKNKILAISEEEGAHTASYALKLLQSEGEVTIASTGKDDSTGQLVTREYKVEGPVMLFLTTTAIDIDEELLNRCLVLTVNESREQTEAIHHAQRLKRTLKGLESKIEKALVLQLHRNAQRLLKPLTIINPYADQLTFLADKTRTRRDHEKYLTLIDSIALLHQYQREIKKLGALDYIEVTTQDIALANRLAHEVLGKTLDELPPQTRQLLTIIHRMVSASCKAQGVEQHQLRFSRKQIREFSGWGNTQLKIHCNRLEDMEYLLVHRGGRGQSFDYELLYQGEGEKGKAFVMGLVDATLLQHKNEKQNEIHVYDEKKSGQKVKLSGSSRPQVGGMSGQEKPLELSNGKAFHEWQHDWEKGAYVAV